MAFAYSATRNEFKLSFASYVSSQTTAAKPVVYKAEKGSNSSKERVAKTKENKSQFSPHYS